MLFSGIHFDAARHVCMCTCIACACGAHAHAHSVLYASWRLFDPVSVEGARTVASAHAAAADAAVAVLAAEQRSAGGFTDQATPVPTIYASRLAGSATQTDTPHFLFRPAAQATMRLRCKACGHIMVGDYEARLHAGQSGHKDFVQDR